MSKPRRITLGLMTACLIVAGMAGAAWAGGPRTDVIGEADIRAKIDQRVDTEAADRQAIQDLLRRPEVRRIAGTAGLDIERVSASAATLSGAELKDVAARVRAITPTSGPVGGVQRVTLTVTAIIVILLIILIVT